MSDHVTIGDLKAEVKRFCEERDWDQFHDPKSLASGIVTEAAELLAHFRFASNIEAEHLLGDARSKEKIEDEVADVMFFVLRFAQRFDVDLTQAFRRKLAKNAERYPVEKSKGRNLKYTEL